MNAPGLWDDLLGTLRSERTTYHHLSTLLMQEQDALRRMASDLLLDITEKKKMVLSDLRDLDARRLALFETLLGPQLIQTPLDWLPHLAKAPTASRFNRLLLPDNSMWMGSASPPVSFGKRC